MYEEHEKFIEWIQHSIFPADNMTRHHVIISGTGRAGTTFLIMLLTHLGLDTGFMPSTISIDKNARAGLEVDIRDEHAPYIIKNPWLCDYIGEVLASKEIIVDHAYIPIRDLSAASKSRIYVEKNADRSLSSYHIPGGLWHTKNPDDQERILSRQLYNIIYHLTKSEVPVTFIHYPRLIKDPHYVYQKLQFLLSEIPYDTFARCYYLLLRPDFVHSFTDEDA